MPPKVALLIGVLFILFVFSKERERKPGVSSAIILPFVWYGLAASRPIGVWLWIWGIHLGSGSVDPREGSFIDRWFLTVLIIIGIIILKRRKCEWNEIVKENAWLFVLFVFMACSILWSGFPVVSLKRFIKCIGAAIMALIVLTETRRVEAISAVLRRVFYFHIPLSIITIRYFRQIGISWDWSGNAQSWIGIATAKNTLGQVAAISALVFFWERVRRWHEKEGRIIDFMYLGMSLYLLKGSDETVSMTSVSLFVFCMLLFFALHFMRTNLSMVKPFLVFMVIILIITLSSVISLAISPGQGGSLIKTIILDMHRDPTLTGRTDIWRDVLNIASRSPWLGIGFGGFWIGRIANIPWNADMTWILGQAHNGYVDMYLQVGWMGILLFAGVVFTVISKMDRFFYIDFEYGRFCMILFVLILFANITESTLLRGFHHMWFLFLLVSLFVPSPGAIKTLQRDHF